MGIPKESGFLRLLAKESDLEEERLRKKASLEESGSERGFLDGQFPLLRGMNVEGKKILKDSKNTGRYARDDVTATCRK